MFDKLREHSRYVEKTIQKISTDLTNINLDNTGEKNIDCVLNLDCSIENEIDDLLTLTRETNSELEVLHEETEESVSVLTKQLEYLEEYFNLKPIEIDDSNGNLEKPNSLVQIIVDEPEDETNNVQAEQFVTKVEDAPVNDTTTSLLSILEMKEREKLITPPKVIYSKIIERKLAMRRNCENETIPSND
ncbi:hypothetical protein CBL_02790 [Carabus blaptoides fortunei]